MCITKEEYVKLNMNVVQVQTGVEEVINLAKENKSTIQEMKSDLDVMRPQVEKTSVIVTGNGDPSKGLAAQYILLKKVLDDHLKMHDAVEDKAWDVVRPILSKLVEWAFLGGLLYYLLESTH